MSYQRRLGILFSFVRPTELYEEHYPLPINFCRWLSLKSWYQNNNAIMIVFFPNGS